MRGWLVCVMVLAPSLALAQTDSTGAVQQALLTGERLPAGTYWVQAGAVVVNKGRILRGSGPNTIIRPITPKAGSGILNMFSMNSAGRPHEIDVDTTTGMPRGGAIEDLRIMGTSTPYEYGILIRGALFRVENVTITHTWYAIGSNWGVNIVIRNPLLSRNAFGFLLWDAITTFRVEGGNIRENKGSGLFINFAGIARQISFHNTTFESNRTYGVDLSRAKEPVLFEDCWFEANYYGNWYDPQRKAVLVRPVEG